MSQSLSQLRAAQEAAKCQADELEAQIATAKKEEKEAQEREKKEREKREREERAKREKEECEKKEAEARKAAEKSRGGSTEQVAKKKKKQVEVAIGEVPGSGSLEKGKKRSAEWVEDEGRGTCQGCEDSGVVCKWPVGGRGKSCEACVDKHATCHPAGAEPPPKRSRGNKAKERTGEAESADSVVQELRLLREQMAEDAEKQRALLELIYRRVRTGNRLANESKLEIQEIVSDLRSIARRAGPEDEAQAVTAGMRELEVTPAAEAAERADAEMGGPEEEREVEKVVEDDGDVAE